jgi:hypothetical protein
MAVAVEFIEFKYYVALRKKVEPNVKEEFFL